MNFRTFPVLPQPPVLPPTLLWAASWLWIWAPLISRAWKDLQQEGKLTSKLTYKFSLFKKPVACYDPTH